MILFSQMSLCYQVLSLCRHQQMMLIASLNQSTIELSKVSCGIRMTILIVSDPMKLVHVGVIYHAILNLS